jgi:hypothetical protein
MNTKKTTLNAIVILIALSPIAYLLIVWNVIPETIVTRFNISDPIDKPQSRETLLYATIILSVVSAGMYLLLRNLKRVDPKVKKAPYSSSFNKLGLSLTIFLTLLNYYFILTAQYSWEVSLKTLFIFGALLFAVLGNYMNNIKPNFFAGIRLPWTLNDENNWRQTHHLASKLWFAGGLLLAVLAWLLPVTALKPVFLAAIILLVLIPGIYSYRLFKSKG